MADKPDSRCRGAGAPLPTQQQLTFAGALTQVEPRRKPDGEDHTGVAVVAGEQQDQGGHHADGDGYEPGDSRQGHRAAILAHGR